MSFDTATLMRDQAEDEPSRGVPATVDRRGDLTAKQDAFAMAYVECGNASEAYRRAYSAGHMTAGAIEVEASRLRNNPKVALRIGDLQRAHVERHVINVD